MAGMRAGLRALAIAAALAIAFGSAVTSGYGQSAGDSDATGSGKTVTVEGVGAIVGGDLAQARDEAVVDAYRRALEAAGVSVSSHTTVENFQVLIDEITANASGYIQSLTIVGEHSDGRLYRVQIRAVVVDGDFTGDQEALAVLIGLMDHPTVAVAVGGPAAYAGVVETELAGRFAAAGYHVVQSAAVPSGTVARLATQEDRRLSLLTALASTADILVAGTVDADSLGTVQIGEQSLDSAEATLRLRVTVGATGQTLYAGTQAGRALHLTAAAALRQASQDAADEAGDGLVWTVARAYSPLVDGSRDMQVIVFAPDYPRFAKVLAQVRALREVAGQAFVRAYQAGIGVIDVRSRFPPQALLPRLTALGLHVVAVQANRVVLESLAAH